MIKKVIGNCELYCGDSMDILPTLDKVDAIVTDPPYGINFGNFNRTNKDSKGNRYKADKYHNSDWDKEFNFEPFFNGLNKLNKQMIVWGGNYFPCLWVNPVKGIIFWNKKQPCANFSKGELAWTNIDMPAQHIEFAYYGNIEGNTSASKKEHPTQKPVQVIKHCINYLKEEPQIILDPFMGSGTTGVACQQMGRKFIGIEKEPKYFDIACKRIEEASRQGDLFV